MVYHSRYLNFFERARTEWLRARGIDQAELARDRNLLFAIRHMDIDFRRPARMDDRLAVSVESVATGGSKLCFSQVMHRVPDEEPICRAQVTAACLEADSFRPVRVPDWLRAMTGNRITNQEV